MLRPQMRTENTVFITAPTAVRKSFQQQRKRGDGDSVLAFFSVVYDDRRIS
jgi:hypothetical protein